MIRVTLTESTSSSRWATRQLREAVVEFDTDDDPEAVSRILNGLRGLPGKPLPPPLPMLPARLR